MNLIYNVYFMFLCCCYRCSYEFVAASVVDARTILLLLLLLLLLFCSSRLLLLLLVRFCVVVAGCCCCRGIDSTPMPRCRYHRFDSFVVVAAAAATVPPCSFVVVCCGCCCTIRRINLIPLLSIRLLSYGNPRCNNINKIRIRSRESKQKGGGK